MLDKHNTIRTALLCGSALSMLYGAAALAQDAEATSTASQENTDGEVFSLDPIIVRDRDPLGQDADRASSIYLSDAELENARLGNAKDLFDGIANVSVGGAIPLTQKIYVNGIDLINLTTQIDGALQNNRVFHHTSATVFDPGMLKFVRVDPGVAAADTGPNATAGAVIMKTIDAGDIIADGRNAAGTVRLSYGNNGDTFARSLVLAGRSNGFEALGYGRSTTGNPYEDGAGTLTQGTAADMQTGLLKFAYESDQGNRFELSGQRIKDSEERNEKPNFGNWAPPFEMDLVPYDTERSSYSFQYSNTQAEGMWDPQVVIGYSDADVTRTDTSYEGVSSTFSGKIQNTFNIGSGFMNGGSVVAGLDFYDKDSTFTDPTYSLKERVKNIGAFAQARFDPSERWSISTGARYDTQDFTGVDGTDLSDSGGSYNMSATYFVNDALSLRASYSNVFGGYQIEDNYKFWTTDYSGFESSRGENINLGVGWDAGNLHVSAELFRTSIDDARMMAYDRMTDMNLHSAADVRSQGFNLDASYAWYNGSMRVTYTNADLTINGADPGTYEAQAFGFGTPIGQRIALQAQHFVPQLNTLFGATVDMAFDNDATAVCDTCSGLDGYTVVNIFGEYTPPSFSNLTVRLSVNNLFDEDYSDRATYGADYTTELVPLKEPGRTVVVEAVARF
ncbi:TonB-dependent receptor [Rhodobacteraceae bacterium B1Z28]|uniref:TonB-dependent receptor n=1 Tax=Ruegeria haliotis TaxID=2747601 RepID=A0ABX2PTN9_9RHOB|nr:TonB-dependent receptor [Ruegeria haliotis]NVO56736.1 TonB-dependent receptor [Ruegeria haliotis]